MSISNYTHALLKRLRRGVRHDPARDWFMTLIFFGIALVVISIWNVWTFQTIANGGIMDAQAVTAPPIFDRPLLDSARTIIENRAVEEAKYKIDVYHYTDPSQ